MMPPLLDFWFDFASTYSYPAAMQIAPVAQQGDSVEVDGKLCRHGLGP
jgi:2-hydroxychromene-2-carboxylate isomerase